MKVIVHNLAVEYNDTGEGPLLLFLHGWGSSSKAFDALGGALKDKYRIITVDFPGFGGTQQPKEDWFIADYAKFVADFLQKVAPQTDVYALFGHSFGGRVIVKAVSHNVVSADKLILMGAAGIKPKTTAKLRFFKLIAKVGKGLMALPVLSRFAAPLRQRLYGAIGSTDYLNSGSMKKIFLNTINEDLRDDARRISTPALLLWGEQDMETPLDQGREMQSLLQSASLKTFPQAGHYVFLDEKDGVLKQIEDFLND